MADVTGTTAVDIHTNNGVGFYIGQTANGSDGHWDGKIDEVGLWTREITSAEETTLYNSGDGLQYPFTTGYGNTINGISSYSKVNGIAVADITKINGVS